MKTLGEQIKVARQQRHMSQSELARQVGCKQSALSMFEGGRHTALNATVIGKLCETLGLLPPTQTEMAQKSSFHQRTFCPNASCPSNLPLIIGNQVVLVPHKHFREDEKACHCAWCGEVLEHTCPECGEPINAGAFCAYCGSPYIFSSSIERDLQRSAESERLIAWTE